ncbi:sensor histidine kinase LiaS [Ktedonobacter sp. SOSP1-52]|uniref:sensor histidine kinase n=1 Tax=Ktedonobacter sp. SOSP1-52 TaxID=2778366 RepID=UPI001915E2C4|nr:sensor histidine kinase [Ktedonobacter sp. SOSP1-52]GHO65441.1 sensor histidine kinase LiaS [Ktedonobacter sp. SOSP1-52]
MEQQENKSTPLPPPRFAPASRQWSRLQIRMAFSYVLMTAVIVLLFELVVAAILFIVLTQTPILNQMFPHMGREIDKLRTDIITSIAIGWLRSIPGLLLLMAPVGMLFGLITTRSLVQRLQRLITATDHFASGDYTQRVSISQSDEIGQLEQHFNRMAEQLEASIAQQRILHEQSARLEERARIARDLHDSVKQQVFALSMQLGAAMSLLDSNQEKTRQHLESADALTLQVRQELTTLIQELRPVALQTKNLSTALKGIVSTWSQQQGIQADTQILSPCTLAPAVEEALLRITQEALSNVARHSSARKVEVTLGCEHKCVQLSIRDFGSGFEIARRGSSGVGLSSMRERIEALRGSLVLQSVPGEGTQITARCPCS